MFKWILILPKILQKQRTFEFITWLDPFSVWLCERRGKGLQSLAGLKQSCMTEHIYMYHTYISLSWVYKYEGLFTCVHTMNKVKPLKLAACSQNNHNRVFFNSPENQTHKYMHTDTHRRVWQWSVLKRLHCKPMSNFTDAEQIVL